MCLCSLCVWMCGYIILIKFDYFSLVVFFFCVVSWTPSHKLWDSNLLLVTPSLVVCPAQLMRSLEYRRYDGVSLLFSVFIFLYIYLSVCLSVSLFVYLSPFLCLSLLLCGHEINQLPCCEDTQVTPKNPMLGERASVERTCACSLAPALDTH